MSRRGRIRALLGGAPIAVQVGVLLILTLVAAQALAVAIVVLLPPPPPPVYRLVEVASALQGRTTPETTSAFRREFDDHAPVLGENGTFRESRLRAVLADLLDAPLSDVRLQRRNRGPLASLGRRGVVTSPSLSDDNLARADVAEFFGVFLAAYRQPDGKWVIVQPRRLPFPDPWEGRLLLWILGCLLLIAPTAWWFAGRFAAPIRLFADGAKRLQRDTKAPPLPIEGPLELQEAASAFNDMQEAIQRYVHDRTTMFSAISHDLRTPLSRMRFKLEGALDRQAILSDVLQMERMVTSVLTFARDEAQARAGEPFELRSLLELVVEEAELVGAPVSLADGEPLYVYGDVTALKRLITNLVENALRYGGAARVDAERSGAMVYVRVRDEGPGLPDEELEAVFRPFYRGDTARNMDKANPQAGVGLGLSISRAIARAHGGDVVVRNGARNGLVSEVKLPLLA
jgi:two-component system OmpR family sensor kinase